DHPATLFKAAFKEKAGKLTYTDVVFDITKDYEWDVNFINLGVLHIPSWRSQIRLRYFANCENYRHIIPLLTLAIQHRLPFQIGIHAKDFHLFEPGQISHIDRELLSVMYKPGFYEAPFVFQSSAAFADSYRGKVGDMLRRPHTRAFIGMGGPYSWLAERWGVNPIADFMSGPSIQVTRHFRGGNDSAEKNALGIHWDQVSSQETDFLFGHIPATKQYPERWLYPPEHILDEWCDHWTGEWNAGMEAIFLCITSKITRSPPTAVPLSRKGWEADLRSHNRGNKAPAYKPEEEDFTDAKEGLQAAGLPVDWNRQKLTAIIVPEYTIL
ncbi:hypothetical protein M413DRAFT_80253, partial [Hebeloma cylindrosporum]